MNIMAVLGCLLIAQSSLASAYYQNRVVQDNDADVSVTIMRWGVPDNDGMMAVDLRGGAKTDRLVGQVASKKYQKVSLVFEAAQTNKSVCRLTLTTGVHVYYESRNPVCTICRQSRSDSLGASTNSKGAKASGGCFFDIAIPRNSTIRKMRLVDVQADGQSVTYFVNFNVSPDLMRSPTKIPVSKSSVLHSAEFRCETVDGSASAGADEESKRMAEKR